MKPNALSAGAALAPRSHYLPFGILLLALIIDGLDMQLLSLVSPLLLEEWGVDKSALGPAMSAALVGMSFGALIGGWLGDRWGRKRVLAASVFGFGAATAAVALAHSLGAVTVLRLVGGLGFGAAAPNAIALVSEWLDGKSRTRAISLMSIGTPLGGMLGALLLIGLLSSLGWRGSFVLCGLASILIATVIVLVVPESPSYLHARGRRVEATGQVKPADNAEQRVSGRFLWGMSCAFFCISFAAYACAAWIPMLVTMNGVSIDAGLAAVFWFNLCAVVAAISAGFLVTILGSRGLMIAGTLVAGVGAGLLMVVLGPHAVGQGAPVSALVAVAASLAGGGTGSVLATVYMVIAAGFPLARRSTGLGLGMMLGRAGGISATFFGGQLLGDSAADSLPYFQTLFVAVFATLGGIALIDRHLPRARR